MDCDGIGKIELVDVLRCVFDDPVFVKAYRHSVLLRADFLHDTEVAVENAVPLIHGYGVPAEYPPVELIVVPGLHNLVSFAEEYVPMPQLLL